MSLAELAAVDADDASSTTLSLFVHCSRISSSSSSTSTRSSDAIRVQLLNPPILYVAEVASNHKPRALACSGADYVAAVESALSPRMGTKPRFEFRWSRERRSLTLMERSEFAVRFCGIDFQASENADDWRELLHRVAAQQRENGQSIHNKRSKITQLETLLEQKEALLETALAAKQTTEDRLVRGFCAVLNAKKDEIRKLQSEVENVQEMQIYKAKPAAKAVMKRKKKATGAKLKKVEEEEDESSEEESEAECTASEEVDDDAESTQLKRTKRDAVEAYDQLPANLRSSSMQISSAEDLLSSMDEIIKNEEEGDAAMQRGDTSSSIKAEPLVAPPQSSSSVDLSKSLNGSRRETAAVKTEPTSLPKSEPMKPPRLPPPAADEPMDSEEEDILDML